MGGRRGVMGGEAGSEGRGGAPLTCWVVIPARNEAATVASTVRAALAVPGVVGALVVDDASRDGTGAAAAAAGAAVVRLPRRRGKGGALEAGVSRLPPCGAVMFLDADLGATARAAGALLEAVRSGADMAVGVLARPARRGGVGAVRRLARWGVSRLGGRPLQGALSGQRCMTRAAAELLRPFAAGWGAEVGMGIAALRRGLVVREVHVAMAHRATGRSLAGAWHRGGQLLGVARALVGIALCDARARGADAAPGTTSAEAAPAAASGAKGCTEPRSRIFWRR